MSKRCVGIAYSKFISKAVQNNHARTNPIFISLKQRNATCRIIRQVAFLFVIVAMHREYKVRWDYDAQTLTFYREKKESIEVDISGGDFLPIHHRSKLNSIESSSAEIWDDGTSEKQGITEDISQEKQVYEDSIPIDVALEMLGKRAVISNMYRIFKQAYVDYGICDYIKGIPKRKFNITPFVDEIEKGLISNFKEHVGVKIYKYIFEFYTELKKFHELSSQYTLEALKREKGKLVERQRQKLESLYEGIRNATGEDYTMIHDYENDPDEILISWVSDIKSS